MLEGKFDGYEAPKVTAWLQENIGPQSAQLLIDLEKVNFLDSIALATLVQGMKRCREHGGDLYLCSLQKPVRVIFELTRLDKAFQIFEGRDQALQNF